MLLGIVLALFGLNAQPPATVPDRCVNLEQTPDQRVAPPPQIAPGPPPALSFRYYEGKLHHRFDDSDVMLDDAGH